MSLVQEVFYIYIYIYRKHANSENIPNSKIDHIVTSDDVHKSIRTCKRVDKLIYKEDGHIPLSLNLDWSKLTARRRTRVKEQKEENTRRNKIEYDQTLLRELVGKYKETTSERNREDMIRENMPKNTEAEQSRKNRYRKLKTRIKEAKLTLKKNKRGNRRREAKKILERLEKREGG